MADVDQPVTVDVHPFALFSLRIFPLWEGDAERVELGDNLPEIIERIVREKSVAHLIGTGGKPMRYCRIEQEEALYLPRSQQTFYARERTPVWKVMVPASGVYRRETILSCIARGAGRNTDKYEEVLFRYPKSAEFYNFSNNEILPVDDTVFVIERHAR